MPLLFPLSPHEINLFKVLICALDPPRPLLKHASHCTVVVAPTNVEFLELDILLTLDCRGHLVAVVDSVVKHSVHPLLESDYEFLGLDVLTQHLLVIKPLWDLDSEEFCSFLDFQNPVLFLQMLRLRYDAWLRLHVLRWFEYQLRYVIDLLDSSVDWMCIEMSVGLMIYSDTDSLSLALLAFLVPG